MSDGPPLLELTGVVKEYQALRPLRLQALRVSAGSIVSVSGIDAAGAEVLVNLLTAATRPDAGVVRLFGAATDAIEDYEGWLKMLDGLGLLTERAVLLPQCSVAQNVALPLTLEIDPIRAEVLPMVQALATEAGIAPSSLDTLVGEASPAVVQRVRLARALALGPRLLIAEHPSAPLPREAVVPLARDLGRHHRQPRPRPPGRERRSRVRPGPRRHRADPRSRHRRAHEAGTAGALRPGTIMA